MPLLVGMDEAGYGPRLGPLVISATVWRVPDALRASTLRTTLRGALTSVPTDERRIAIADSKLLYKSGGGLRLLERGVLPCLAAAGVQIARWLDLRAALNLSCSKDYDGEPWHDGFDPPLPFDATAEELQTLADRLRRCLRRTGVELIALRSRSVFPRAFNRLVTSHGNKATALSVATIGLLAELFRQYPGEPVFAVCDKHGGRNHYGSLLQMAFPDPLVEVHGEGREVSTYRWGPANARTEVRFQKGGESFPPAALASMLSKYIRELSMRAFNDYWLSRAKDLKPTAGYPMDAWRFRREIEPMTRELGIEESVYWRCC